jgi:hypothetical protein
MRVLALIFCILLTGSYSFAKDVDIAVTDVNFADKIYLSTKTTVYIALTNNSDMDVKDCTFNVEADDGSKVNQQINLPKTSTQRAEIKWVPQQVGKMNFKVTLTPPKDSKNKSDANAQVTKTVEVLTK